MWVRGGVDSVGAWVRGWRGSNFSVGGVGKRGSIKFWRGQRGSKFWCGLACLAWVKKAVGVNVLLFNHSIQKTLRLLQNIIQLHQPNSSSSTAYLLYFVFFLIQVKLLCDAFLDLFSNLCSPSSLFLNCGYLSCSTCKNNKKNYERADRQINRQIDRQIDLYLSIYILWTANNALI